MRRKEGYKGFEGLQGQRISIFGLRVDGLASLRSASRDVATAQGNVGPAHGQARQGRLVTKASTEAASSSRQTNEKQLRSESRLRSPGSSQSSGGPCQAGRKESFQIQNQVIFI